MGDGQFSTESSSSNSSDDGPSLSSESSLQVVSQNSLKSQSDLTVSEACSDDIGSPRVGGSGKSQQHESLSGGETLTDLQASEDEYSSGSEVSSVSS